MRAEVEARLDDVALMAALARAFLDPPTTPDRLSIGLEPRPGSPAGAFLVMPSVRSGGLAVVKLVTVHPSLAARPGGAVRASVMVLDARSGEPLGWVEGHALTLRRTAAASVLAARTLGPSSPSRLLVVGAGALAGSLARAYLRAFALAEVAVWARRPEAAEMLAAALRAEGAPARCAGELDAEVGAADLITCATLSQAPLVRGAWVRPGAHVDLVGGFRPEMREADDALMARARVHVDTPAALREAGDLAGPIAAGVLAAEDVMLLGDALRRLRDRDAETVTVFKSVGSALEDLAAVELLFPREGEDA